MLDMVMSLAVLPYSVSFLESPFGKDVERYIVPRPAVVVAVTTAEWKLLPLKFSELVCSKNDSVTYCINEQLAG